LARIFAALALVAVLLLLANFVVGLAAGDFNAVAARHRESRTRVKKANRGLPIELEDAKQQAAEAEAAFRGPRDAMTLHMLLGAAAALVTVLVNSITITYFIGTSHWCKEVCETYAIRPDLAERSTRLKRSTFPWALAGILSVILVVGLGAAADPSGANWMRSAGFVMPHYIAAMLGLVIAIAVFWVQISRIAENYQVIEEILAEVERIRSAQGVQMEEPSAP
jgi:hypothetical protein